MKTYLLNQNGETITKMKKNKVFTQKSTLENKISQRKMSILARKNSELTNKFNSYKPNNNVVSVQTVSLVQKNHIKNPMEKKKCYQR